MLDVISLLKHLRNRNDETSRALGKQHPAGQFDKECQFRMLAKYFITRRACILWDMFCISAPNNVPCLDFAVAS